MKKPILGSHVGMSKTNKHGEYLIGSINEAISYKANTFMIFTGPPQNTQRTDLQKLHIKELHSLMQENDLNMNNLIVHAGYLINIANSINENTWNFGVKLLIEEILRCEAIGINLLVLHPGARLKGNYQSSLDALVKALDIVAMYQKNVVIALETMSGKGSEVGIQLKDFQFILSNVKNPTKIAVCLDTCHMHDAGYDLNNWSDVKKEIQQTIGKAKVACFHINDSKNERYAHKDRHENIGYGLIGFDNLCKIVWDEDFIDVPKVLETPYHNGESPYKAEISNLLNQEFLLKIK